jgi:chromosomal replication initiation ATPase DnaA
MPRSSQTLAHSPRQAASYPVPRAINRVATLVSRHSNVPQALMFSQFRCRFGVARSRQLAMYLSHVVLGETLTDIGSAFGRDRTTVSHACGLIEDLRDDPAFDAEVAELELQLQNAEA